MSAIPINRKAKFRTLGDAPYEELISKFIDSRRNGLYGANGPNVSENTVKAYRWDLEKMFGFLQSVQGRSQWAEVTDRDITAWVRHLQDKGYAQPTFNHFLRSLKAFMRWVQLDPDYQHLPTFLTVLPKIGRNQARAYVPTPAEVKRFLERGFDLSHALDLRDYVIANMIVDCGMRIGEVVELKMADVKWDISMVDVLGGKMRKLGGRMVPLSPKSITLLKRWLRERERLARTDYLFVGKSGGKIDTHMMNLAFKRHRQMAGMDGDQRITPYTLRHYFATEYLIQGGREVKLKVILGHTSYELLRVYVHEAELRGAVLEDHIHFSPLLALDKVRVDGRPVKHRNMVRQ